MLAAVLLNWALEVDGPETTLQEPTPLVGTLAARVAVPGIAQMIWSGPAFDAVVATVAVITTSSCVEAHGAWLVVQRSV